MLTRRSFCKKSAGILAGISISSSSHRILGANEDIRIGVIGLGLKGPQHVDVFHSLPGVRVVALCDADSDRLGSVVTSFKQRGETVAGWKDFRYMLDNKDVDAVVIATPNHWHALMTILACQASKDVYVEKPISHNVLESLQMVRAVRKYDRIVQCGTQNRSDFGLMEAKQYISEGHLGRPKLGRCFDHPRRESIGRVNGPQSIPAGVNYDLYMGPASLTPLMRKRLHYDWHFFWSTGNGDCGNRGAHSLDHTRWLLGNDAPPLSAISIGGRFVFDDDGQTPNTFIVWFQYDDIPIIYEMRNLTRAKGDPAMDTFRKTRACILEFEGGYLHAYRGGGTAFDNAGKRIRRFKGDGGGTHQANFIHAVRSRKNSVLRADIETGYVTSMMVHMANISYLIGYQANPDNIHKTIAGNEVLSESFNRFCSHLNANEVGLQAEPIVMGRQVRWDVDNETFDGASAQWANMLASRNYRAPFIVPAEV